ncbi:MAG TPA: hypothetical protein VF123_15645 [Candidatus Sulfotelmatobacter sp.]
MEKIMACVLVLGFAGTSSLLLKGTGTKPQVRAISVETAGDAAYRDGLFLGKLNRKERSHMLAPVGRWSTEKDRASFVQGYRQGLDSNERD